MEHVYLVGSEGVQNAGYAMRDAASSMQNSAGEIGSSVDRLQRILDDFICRFEAASERMQAPAQDGK
jgi:hypothetical protein